MANGDYLDANAATAGLKVKLDNGFTCRNAGPVILQEDENGVFFPCNHGHHYVDGQEENNKLVGIYAMGTKANLGTDRNK